MMTTIKYESNFKLVKESFKYSTNRFKQVFSHSNFLQGNKCLTCKKLECEKNIANLIYYKINGNINKEDGYKYLGRGYIQITGKYNYSIVNEQIKNLFNLDFDLVNNPNLLLNQGICILATIAYFDIRNINVYNKKYAIDTIFSIMQNKINSRLTENNYNNRYNYFIEVLNYLDRN